MIYHQDPHILRIQDPESWKFKYRQFLRLWGSWILRISNWWNIRSGGPAISDMRACAGQCTGQFAPVCTVHFPVHTVHCTVSSAQVRMRQCTHWPNFWHPAIMIAAPVTILAFVNVKLIKIEIKIIIKCQVDKVMVSDYEIVELQSSHQYQYWCHQYWHNCILYRH